MNKNYIEIKKCRCCNSKLIEILDLNEQPLANSYHNMVKLKKYPLKLNLCINCFHTQLSIVVKPELMFENYLYVSGTSNTLKEYFKFFADFTKNKYIEYFNEPPDKVLDIACNDGTQLNYYKQVNIKTYGIDPAKNLFYLSSKEHNVICDFFPSNKLTGKYDIIVAQNVFAHTHNILDFLISCKNLLSEKGLLYIQTSQSNMLINNEFDTIYHEHLSFFNSKSMNTIVNRSGLNLNNIYKFDIHGNSYIFEISLNKLQYSNLEENLIEEENKGLYNKNTYIEFSNKSKEIINNLNETIKILKEQGYNIIGYGAAAKGMTLLNFGNMKLDMIIDDNELKHNLYTPGTNIVIKGIDELKNIDNKIAFIPLAWNFYNEIYNKIKNIRKNDDDIFIKYFPKIKINK